MSAIEIPENAPIATDYFRKAGVPLRHVKIAITRFGDVGLVADLAGLARQTD